MDDRANKLHASMIREKLLRGVPPDSTVRDIVANMSDEELIRKEDEADALKVARLSERAKKQSLVGKVVT